MGDQKFKFFRINILRSTETMTRFVPWGKKQKTILEASIYLQSDLNVKWQWQNSTFELV